MPPTHIPDADVQPTHVSAGSVTLDGDLGIPHHPAGVVLFAHDSGSGRHSPRNRHVAASLRAHGFATLLLDLLTQPEETLDDVTRHLRFDIGLLADRLASAIDWLAAHPPTAQLPVGLFGASTGGGAAIVAATRRPDRVRAVVSRGGHPDLAGEALPIIRCPTLLIVGGNDDVVIELNLEALGQLGVQEKELVIVPGASHLFEEPGTLDEVARLAGDWFGRYLRPPVPSGA